MCSPSIPLLQRIEYLARAVMCMRSDQVGYASQLGVFLRELEDKIDVARIQQRVRSYCGYSDIKVKCMKFVVW
jgi:nuclear pore complex protein Nup155